MATRSFDYSKWDNIELSDDESDLHPNIDKESWFRLKHRSRLEREEREDVEVKELEDKSRIDQARISVITSRLRATSTNPDDEDAQYEDVDALQIELDELQSNVSKRNKRIAEIREKRQWNIDNICKVKEEKTIVNNVVSTSLKAENSLVVDDSDIDESSSGGESSTPVVETAVKASVQSASSLPKAPVAEPTVKVPLAPSAEPPSNSVTKRERMAVISYNDFAMKHESVLEKYSEIHDLEATKEFLFNHCDILLHEHAQSYILLSCLEDEMNGKSARMKIVCRQSQILSHIQELGQSMRRDPRDVILPFFKRITESDYLKGFLAAVEDFIAKIQKRAIEKRKEMDAERAAAADEDDVDYDETAVPLGPGGLNPLEVMKKLPIAMRKAFEKQDTQKLQEVLGSMPPAEAKFWMKQCVDSGLWVSKDSTIFEDSAESNEEDEEVQA